MSGRIGRRTSTSGTSDLQAYRDTATITIMVMMGRDQHELDDEHPALLRVVRHSCAGKLAWRQSQCVQQSITDASQVLIFVGGPDKGGRETLCAPKVTV